MQGKKWNSHPNSQRSASKKAQWGGSWKFKWTSSYMLFLDIIKWYHLPWVLFKPFFFTSWQKESFSSFLNRWGDRIGRSRRSETQWPRRRQQGAHESLEIPVKSINFPYFGVSYYCGKGRSTHDDTIIVTFSFWNLLFHRIFLVELKVGWIYPQWKELWAWRRTCVSWRALYPILLQSWCSIYRL